jgi:hypothetical protein
MLATIGLTEDYELRIDRVGFNLGTLSFPEASYSQMMSLLNSDRVNYMGEVDSKIPLKTVTDIDFREVSPKEIEELYKEGQYYPEFKDEGARGAKDKEAPSLTFTVSNLRTFESKQHTCHSSNFTIGRHKECTVVIDDISIRKKELLF